MSAALIVPSTFLYSSVNPVLRGAKPVCFIFYLRRPLSGIYLSSLCSVLIKIKLKSSYILHLTSQIWQIFKMNQLLHFANHPIQKL